ncbi:restriction endonuclease S subunit [Idiomarina sp. A28L]|uniref:restriction endonuclease subunit S n=1 Tax=Idiomarina sp. A28L TaxID=1036674 RepID=UPI0002138E33|nr:restriction endonuclease subunit S [Idiomarina sp. A28L]EGN75577.1 restriction endonuclease S subunit [Idiomarina sp. A28L]
MLPEGWKLQVVGVLFDVQLGKMLNKAAKEKEPQLKYLTNFNVRWGSFDTSRLNTMYFSEREQEKFGLKSGDIILCEGGEVGRCAIWLGTDFPCYYQKALHRLRTKGDILPEYFQAYMASIAGSKLLDDYTSRTSIAHLTREKLVELPVKVPPLPEQKKIAQILSTWDNAISASERLLENSQQRKKALMQQLLTGKKRLPGFERKFIDNELSNIADMTMGTSPKSESYNEYGGGLPVIQGNADIKYRKSSPRIFTSEITKTCSPNDILLSVRAPVGSVAISGHEACIGRGICSIRAKNGNNQNYLYQWMLWYEPRWSSLSQGSTFESVNSKDIKSLKITIPAVDEQKAIANVLTTADQEIDALHKRISHLKQEKKALMQQLLTGKRRVQVGDAA